MATSAKYKRYNGIAWEDIIFPYSHKHEWSDIVHPTTLSGYGITDAKIQNGVITLGGNTITPITSLTGYATQSWVEGKNYLTSITKSNVTTALGFTPYDSTNPNGYTANKGTVTSVGVSVPTGLSVSSSPITSSGTIAIIFANGYSIPTTSKQTNWDTAYSWGDHSTQGYKKTDTNTTYTFANGTNGFTVTPSGGTAQTVTVTPSISVATTSANGLMTKEHVTQLSTMWNVWSADDTSDSLVNKVQEVLKVFENYPEASNLITLLNGKQDSGDYLTTTNASSTYVTKANAITGLSISGTTITYTKGNGTTGTLTTKDSNTTYGAGTGLSLSTSNDFSVLYGTTAGTACQGNDSRLSDSRPASDVYSWAKASSKPSYSWSEITSRPTIPTVDTTLSSTSSNAISNKAVYTALQDTENDLKSLIPTKADQIICDDDLSVEEKFSQLPNIYAKKTDVPSAVTESTVSGWGFTKNSGTVTSVKVGTTSYNPTSGVVTLPAYPTVNNATLTIQKNGTNVATFTANSSSNATANIVVPTKTSDLTNDSNFATKSDIPAAYTLPNATASVLGGVKIGSNITVSSGTISLTKSNVTSALGYTPPTTNTTYSEASESAAGLMSAADKTHLNTLVGLLTEKDSSTTIDTITEVLNAFAGISEGTTVANALAAKQNKVAKLGSTSKPVYVSAEGTFSEASTYAGGTAVTLNGTSKSGSTASFYAPTSLGTNGQVLKSNGTALYWASDNDTDTHYTTKLVATSSSGTANAATTNGNTYLRLFDDSTARSSINIKGTGATTVTTDANGVITINSTDNNTTYESKSAASGGTAVSLVTTGEKYTWNNKQNAITSSNKLAASNVSGLATVATSGKYSDLTGTPTIPTNTSQLNNDSGFLTSHQSLENYVTLNGSQTISGVKTHTALIKTAENTMGLKLRTHDNYETGWVYGTSGNEAITLAIQNPVTAFQIVYGTKPSSFAGSTWQSVTPLFQTKDGKVIINRKIAATADTSSLKLFDVNGDAAATTFYENGTSLSNKYFPKANIKVKGTSVSTLDLREGNNVTLTTNSDGTVSINSTASGGSGGGLTEGGSLNSATIGDFYCKYINDSTASGTSSAYVETGDLIYCVNTYASQSWVTQNFVKKCLLEGTMITMADGTKKPIEEVKEGDLVKSIDIETGKETQAVVLANPVGDVENYYFMMMFEDGSSLKTNWTHDVYNATKGTWAKSDCDMYLDDEVIKENGTRTKFIGTIDTIGTTGGKRCNFYDIVVSNNCYYADGILCATNPISQYRWLIPALNKYAKEIPQELINIISTYRDEDSREADLVHNNEYMAHYIRYMGDKMKKEAKLRALKTELANTDYITLKVSEGVEITPEIQEKLDARAWWRSLYNEYEAELNVIYDNINKLKVKYSPLGEDILLDNISLRRKFFLESCRKANANLNKFKNYYRNSDKFQVGY